MPTVTPHPLPPTSLIPSSPYPLLHYPAILSRNTACNPAAVHDLFSSNGWDTQWIYRYGPTQRSHYHSQAHECMAVLTGRATIRFGVADTSDDLERSTHGDGHEQGGVEVQANAGDVFLIPAGVSHKTYDTRPVAEFALLTPGDGHHIAAADGDVRAVLAATELSGFTMVGAYPRGSVWDSCTGGEHAQKLRVVHAVPKPERDPVLGTAREGLCGLW
ncbi:hypothetical protein LTR08_007343 [Meristemomyces frigidus]|nr:hypothetical protein LTR08_007343 [Meristemomyces frigidus]